MARITYSALVTEIKGSIGGTTFQSNAYGFTVKNKPNIVKPNTPLQKVQQVYFSAAAKLWASISQSTRDSWDTWASNNPQYAKNNPTSVLTGQAVFIKWNALYMLLVGSIANPGNGLTQLIITVDTAAVTLSRSGAVLTFAQNWTNNTDELYALWFLSRPFNDAQNFVGTTPRFVYASSNADDTTDIASVYSGIFGTLPAAGQVVNAEVRLIGQDNGQVFARQTYRVVVS